MGNHFQMVSLTTNIYQETTGQSIQRHTCVSASLNEKDGELLEKDIWVSNQLKLVWFESMVSEM